MPRIIKQVLLLIFLVGFQGSHELWAQNIPTGDIKEDLLRTYQLISDSVSTHSFSNRPVWISEFSQVEEQLPKKYEESWWNNLNGNQSFLSGNFGEAGTYSPTIINTFNSKLPHGGNNGSSWYGRGINTELKLGVYLTSKYLTIVINPHLNFHQNSEFKIPRFIRTNTRGNPDYQAIIYNIDMPFQFGSDSYSNFDLGNSSIRLHYKQLEAGLTKETLWWGPGIFNALVLSNNAAGLKQVFLGTRAPLKLPLNIGAVEFRLLGGWPEDSKYFWGPGSNQDRFLSGANIIYSPSFMSNLHLGFSRVSHRYVPSQGLKLSDYFSSISFGNRQTTGIDSQNQLISLHFRWVFPESSAEIYGEYFRDDSFFDLRDLFLEPDSFRAYTIGAQKILKSDWIDFYKVYAEVSNLVPTRVDEVRPQKPYYAHLPIRQGHTNEGEVLGAAIGPGSGSQTFGIDGYFTKGMLGLFIQRVEKNDQFHFEYYDRPNSGTHLKDIWRHRINLNIGLKSHYKHGSFLFSGKLVWNKNYNYGRFNLGDLDVDFESVEKNDVVNLQLQLSARYLF